MTYLNVSADCRPGFCSPGTRQQKQVYLCRLGSSAHRCEHHSPIRVPGGTHPPFCKLFCKRSVRLKKKKKKGWKTQQIWIQCSSVQFSFIKGFSLAQQLFLGLHMRVNTWGSYSSYRSATLRSWLCRKCSWCFGGVFFSAQPGYRQPGVFLERIEHLLLPHCRRDETMITIVCIQ